MNYIDIRKTGVLASEISLGCRRWGSLSGKDALDLILAAMDEGINFFDHADIYGNGRAEEVFGDAIRSRGSSLRGKLIVQSKCALRKVNGRNYYDQSREHILGAVDGILKRLKTDYIDVLLLHRPDVLAEPEEIAEAFRRLEVSGKVRLFGVSNYNVMQISLLQKYLEQKLVINQLQASLAHTLIFDSGFRVNMRNGATTEGILEYCRLNGIALQVWSPLQQSDSKTLFIGCEKYTELNAMLTELSEKYDASPAAICFAWLLRVPGDIQVNTGTTNAQRLKSICRAPDIKLTRTEWYELYRVAGNALP